MVNRRTGTVDFLILPALPTWIAITGDTMGLCSVCHRRNATNSINGRIVCSRQLCMNHSSISQLHKHSPCIPIQLQFAEENTTPVWNGCNSQHGLHQRLHKLFKLFSAYLQVFDLSGCCLTVKRLEQSGPLISRSWKGEEKSWCRWRNTFV